MSPEIEKAYEYCRSVTRIHAKSFYFAAKFLPAPKRLPIYALYALCRHVDDEVDENGGVDNEREAGAAVENWKAKLDELYGGQPSAVSRQPETEDRNLVLLAWRDLLKTYKIPQALPLELMKGVLMDTHVKRYETFDELYVYCYRVASTVGLMSSEIFGYTDENAPEYAEALGIAMQLTNILRDVGEDASMNRIYLPAEDLRKFGVSENQIFESRADENFIELMKFEIRRAREFYKKSEKGIALLEKDARFSVLLAARIYAKILDEIERQNYDVFKRRAHTSFSQKIFSLPRIWRESKKPAAN
ncbi:MAG: phytoene/squalene synthase family protein [Acidobacteriota bacterium]|nr:phytoene/squalene synthase family protein [Acidobacteriota bacterium]